MCWKFLFTDVYTEAANQKWLLAPIVMMQMILQNWKWEKTLGEENQKKEKSNFCIGKSHMHPMTFDLRLNAKISQ